MVSSAAAHGLDAQQRLLTMDHPLRGHGKLSLCKVARKPASSPVELSVPPTARIAIEDVSSLRGAKSETGNVGLLRSKIMHGEDIFLWFRGGLFVGA